MPDWRKASNELDFYVKAIFLDGFLILQLRAGNQIKKQWSSWKSIDSCCDDGNVKCANAHEAISSR
jgi:hypothetical protein